MVETISAMCILLLYMYYCCTSTQLVVLYEDLYTTAAVREKPRHELTLVPGTTDDC